mgnify:CR=1 FL=1
MVFANSTARDSGIAGSKRQDGQFYFLKDTEELGFFDGSNFVAFIGTEDISAVTITTAGTSGLSGGATASSYNFDKAIFAYGEVSGSATAVSNLVSNSGVVSADVTAVGTARAHGGAAGFSTSA